MAAQHFLIDTNIVIAALGKSLPLKGLQFIKTVDPVISVITQIELLGWQGASDAQLIPLIDFIEKATVFPLENEIVQKTISIRQKI